MKKRIITFLLLAFIIGCQPINQVSNDVESENITKAEQQSNSESEITPPISDSILSESKTNNVKPEEAVKNNNINEITEKENIDIKQEDIPTEIPKLENNKERDSNKPLVSDSNTTNSQEEQEKNVIRNDPNDGSLVTISKKTLSTQPEGIDNIEKLPEEGTLYFAERIYIIFHDDYRVRLDKEKQVFYSLSGKDLSKLNEFFKTIEIQNYSLSYSNQSTTEEEANEEEERRQKDYINDFSHPKSSYYINLRDFVNKIKIEQDYTSFMKKLIEFDSVRFLYLSSGNAAKG